jgi:hypothetical protein
MTSKLRTCLALLTAALAPQAVLAGDAPIRLSEPVAVTETHETFGAPMPDGAPITLQSALAAGDAHLGHPIVIETEIVEVCQKKGCFFIARSGDATARVTFADYGFFIPTDAGGKRVTLAGTLTREALDEEKAKHLAEDLGRPGDMLDPFEYAIVATSVRIPKG